MHEDFGIGHCTIEVEAHGEVATEQCGNGAPENGASN
jgi:hypothetical protein